MKRLACGLIALAIMAIIFFLIAFFGHSTIGCKEILSHIGGCAIGIWSARCAWWIIDKITDRHE